MEPWLFMLLFLRALKKTTMRAVALPAKGNDWYGWRMSQIGQTVSSVYGNPLATDRFKYYRVVDSYQTFSGSIPTSASAFANTGQDPRLSYVGQGNDPAYKWVTDVGLTSYASPFMGGSITTAIATANGFAVAYAYSLAPSTTLIHSYLDGLNTVSAGGSSTLNALHAHVYPGFSGYIYAYDSNSSHGGPYPLRLIEYEGGINNANPGYTTSDATITVNSITPGNPTVLNVSTDNAFNYICGTYSDCPGSVSPTTTFSGFSASNCTLNGNNPVVTAATATTITVAFDSSSGNTGCGPGKTAYDGSGTYIPTFQIAAMSNSSFTACELANMDDFYQQTIAAGATPEFPAIYNMNSPGTFGLGRYFPTLFDSPGGTLSAVASFQSSQSGSPTCSP